MGVKDRGACSFERFSRPMVSRLGFPDGFSAGFAFRSVAFTVLPTACRLMGFGLVCFSRFRFGFRVLKLFSIFLGARPPPRPPTHSLRGFFGNSRGSFF